METLTTAEAAERLGVNVQKFFRLAETAGIQPALAAPGLRGAKFWHAHDIDALATQRAAS